MKKRLKYTLLGMLPMVLLVVFAGFFITGSFFLTRVMLPLVSCETGTPVVAAEMTWNPFTSTLRAKRLRVGAEERPIFFAAAAELRYDWRMLFDGGVRFADVVLDRADFSLYRLENGRWSCVIPEPGVARSPQKRTGDEDGKKQEPIFLDLRNLRVRDSRFTLIYGDPAAGGAFELSNFSGECSRFRNGESSHIALHGNLRLVSSRENHVDSGRIKLVLNTRLNDELLPCALELNGELGSLEGEINGRRLNGGALSLILDAAGDDNVIDIGKLTLSQSADGVTQSFADLTGRVAWKPFAFQVDCNSMKLSPEVMAILFDLGFGFNPGRATLDCFGRISYQDRSFLSAGRIRLERRGDAIFGLEKVAVPDFELTVDHDAAIDLEESSIDLKTFALELDSKGRSTASIRLRKPVNYSWKGSGTAPEQAAEFDLDFNAFDLRLLRFAIPSKRFQIDSGIFSMRSQLIFQHNLSGVSVLGSARIAAPRWQQDGRRFVLEEIRSGFDGDLKRDRAFQLRDFSLSLRGPGNLDFGSLHIDGGGRFSAGTKWNARLERLSPEFLEWLSPQCAAFSREWRRFGLDPASVLMQAEIPPGGGVKVGRFEAAVRRGDDEFLRFSTDPFILAVRKLMLRDSLRFKLSAAAPAPLLNRMLGGTAVKLESGRVRCEFSGSLARTLASAVLEGDVHLDDLNMTWGERGYRDFSVQNQFSLYLPDFHTFEFKTTNFYLRRNGKPALRLECPGIWDLKTGNYQGDWAIRYINDQFISLLAPGLTDDAQLTGKFQLLGRENFTSLRIAGALDCTRWQMPEPEKAPLSGKAVGVVELDRRNLALRGFKLTTRQNGEALCDLGVEATVDRREPGGAVKLKLHSGLIDLERILAALKQPAPEHPAPAAVPPSPSDAAKASVEPPRLDFGRRPIDLKVKVDEIRVGTGVKLTLNARAKFDRDRVATDSFLLGINRSLLRAKLAGTTTPEGIRAEFSLDSSEPIELRPLAELALGIPEEGLAGTLDELSGEVSYLDTGRPGSVAATLSGRTHAVVRTVVIPTNVTNGPFGKVLLFPVEMISELGGTLPDELRLWHKKVFREKELRARLRSIAFERGRVALRADRGQVTVEECCFFGDWVTRLFFSGTLDLTGEQALQLESRVTIGGMQFVIPVVGTLASPAVDLQKFASSSFSDLVRKLSELKLIGLDGGHNGDGTGEPVIVIQDLPTGKTLRELKSVFDGFFRKKD